MATIPNQLDNLKISGIQEGKLEFFSKVARELHIQNGSTSSGWLDTVQQLNDIAQADGLRTTSFQDTDTVRYAADDIFYKGSGNVVNQASLESYTGSIPTMFTAANGIIENSYTVIIPEKKFYANTIGFQSNVDLLNTFINSTLDTNTVYANANVSTSVQYSIDNGFVTDWTHLSSADFDVSPNSKDVQDLAEENLAKLKSTFLVNKFLG